MLARGHGRIVNVSSSVGLSAIPMVSAYVVSKTALYRLSENLAAETRGHGVMVFVYLASGAADVLSGRNIDVSNDVAQMVARAAEIEEHDLYVLRERE
jgi:short-subunit dehydrogenase